MPVVSVTRINGQYFVFVVEGGERGTVARQRAVTLGEVIDSDYVVRSGLKPGERLIAGGIQKIGEGAPVTPMPVPTKPGEGAHKPGDVGTAEKK